MGLRGAAGPEDLAVMTIQTYGVGLLGCAHTEVSVVAVFIPAPMSTIPR